jgi:anti-anti-sigma factor
MKITTRQVNEVLVADLEGKLSYQTSGYAYDELVRIAQGEHGKVLLNLRGLEYISSAGLRAIIVAAKLLQTAGAEMLLCEARDEVRQVLEMSFQGLLRNYESEAEALAAFSR